MSINKIFLPELKHLEVFLKENGSHELYGRYIKKADATVGPSASHAFIEDFMKYYREGEHNTFYIIPQLKLF